MRRRAGWFLPRSGMAGLIPGMSRPGSRPCQYSGWKASLPRWFSRDGRSSGSPSRAGVVTGQRLGVVVEVDQQGLAAAGLDEAVGVPVERRGERLPGQEPAHVAGQHLALEVRDRAGLGGGHVGGVAEGEHVRLDLRLEGVRVDRDEAERVAEAGRTADVGGAAVQRDDHGQVEGDHPFVVGDQAALPARLARGLDGPGAELGHQLDALAGQQAGQLPAGHRLGERAVQRRDVGEVHPVPDAAPAEVVVGEEAELQRRDRALDRHVDDVDDQPAAVEPGQRPAQGLGALGGVEGEDVLLPARPGQPLGLLRQQPGAGRHDQDVVVQRVAGTEVHPVMLDVDVVDAGLAVDDAGAELPPARPRDPPHVGPAERDEQQPGLVHVIIVAVHHDDLDGPRVVRPPQPVRDQRPAGAATEDNDPFHTVTLGPGQRPDQGRRSRSR